MLENIILWAIIAAAAIYCGRTAYRTLTGKSRGCGCGCDPSQPPPQQSIPDFTKRNKGQDKDPANP